jgi:hypothetical protein
MSREYVILLNTSTQEAYCTCDNPHHYIKDRNGDCSALSYFCRFSLLDAIQRAPADCAVYSIAGGKLRRMLDSEIESTLKQQATVDAIMAARASNPDQRYIINMIKH